MPIEARFASKDVADSFREEHAEHLADRDDRRLKTVKLVDDAPGFVVDRAEAAQVEARAAAEGGFGQTPLTEHEREEIDFSKGRANVPHARSVKAALTQQGVGDWLAHYDPTLTVDEHVSTVAEAGRGGGEPRERDEDDPEVLEERRTSAARAAGRECNHAENFCRHGDPEACEFLGEACGFDEAEIEAIMGVEGDVPEDTADLSGPALGALQRAWTGYTIGIQRAKQFAGIINTIHAENDLEPVEFEELGDRVIAPETAET